MVTKSQAGGRDPKKIDEENRRRQARLDKIRADKIRADKAGGTKQTLSLSEGAIATPEQRRVFDVQRVPTRRLTDIELSQFTGQDAALARERVAGEERREAFQEETGSGELAAELQEKITNQPDLAPDPLLERTADLALEPSEFLAEQIVKVGNALGANWEVVTSEEYAKTTQGKFVGNLILGTATAAGITATAVLAAPIVTSAASSTLGASIIGTGGSATLLKTATAGLALFIVGKGVFDFRGDEMDTHRGRVQKVIEDGERIEASVRNGLPATDTIPLLEAISEEVDFAEQRIKELGEFNVQYRVSEEYLLDMSRIRSARLALQRRVIAIENIAATGTAAYDPVSLLYNSMSEEDRK